MKKMSKFLVMSILLTLSIVLCGCADKKSEGGSSTDGTSTVVNPKIGGKVVVGIQQDLDSLDPHKATGAGTKEVLFNIYEGLVKPDENGNLVPAVAKDYSVSDDSKTYTFTLREGVKFHNGNEVTAEDVKYSIDRCAGLLDGETTEPLVSAFSEVKEVQIKDSSTVDIVLKESDTEFIAYLTTAIVPKDYAELSTKPVGTGPFKFSSYSAGDKFTIVKNDDYYNKDGMPYLDEVDFKIVANTDSVLLDLKAGSIDIYPYLTSDQATELSTNMNILDGYTNLVQALYINNKEKPFDNVKVRQAMNMAIDKQAIMDMVAGGKGHIVGSGLFPALSNYYNADCEKINSYDVAAAKQLLADAGYPDGFEFTVKVPSNYQFHIDTMQVVAEQLSQIGITAKIELIEWTTWLEDVYQGRNYQGTIIGIDSTLAPKDMLSRYQSENSKNFFNYKNDEYDKTVAEAIAATDDNKKAELYKKCQTILADDAAAVYIQDPAKLLAINKKLGGYKFYPLYVQDMSSIYFTE